jgi:hypothetical protein
MDSKMRDVATFRKLTTALLAVAVAVWATAGLALVQGDQVMQCSMSAHEMQAMGNMPCCPMQEMLSLAISGERPPCCSVSQAPERPLGFVVSAKQVKAQSLDVVALLPATFAAPAANHFGVWRSEDAPRFVKPVLELKTDLRI